MRRIVSEKKARVRILQYISLRVSGSGSGRDRQRSLKESIGGLQVAGDRDLTPANVRYVLTALLMSCCLLA